MSLTTNKGRLLIIGGTINLVSDTIKVMQLGTGYTADRTHQFISDIVANELSGTGYTAGFGGAGRKTLAGKSVSVLNPGTDDKAIFDATDVTWTAENAGTIKHFAIVKEVTSDADSPVIAIITLGTSLVTNGSDVTAQWPADGLFYLISP